MAPTAAAPGCSLLSITATCTGAPGANQRKGPMWRCGGAFVSKELPQPLRFLSRTPTHTYACKLARTHNGTNVIEFIYCNRRKLQPARTQRQSVSDAQFTGGHVPK